MTCTWSPGEPVRVISGIAYILYQLTHLHSTLLNYFCSSYIVRIWPTEVSQFIRRKELDRPHAGCLLLLLPVDFTLRKRWGAVHVFIIVIIIIIIIIINDNINIVVATGHS